MSVAADRPSLLAWVGRAVRSLRGQGDGAEGGPLPVRDFVNVSTAQPSRLLGFDQVRLMSNNPLKVSGLEQLGVRVVERVPHQFPSNDHNRFYLDTKRDKSGHLL